MAAMTTYLTLGRISNLPTVWTNVLAAALLARMTMTWPFDEMRFDHEGLLWLGTLLALSLMYVGGMFLNDAFDAKWDRLNNPQRPIAKGLVSQSEVSWLGSAQMIVAIVLIGWLFEHYTFRAIGQLNSGSYAGWLAAAALAATIVLYNAAHKKFEHSAFIMGACRLGVYVVGALLLAQLTLEVMLAGLSLLLYIAGLTYLARVEHLNSVASYWPLPLLLAPVAFAVASGFDTWFFWLYLAGFVGWVVSKVRLLLNPQRRDVKGGIGGLLAAIPLIDGLFLAGIEAYWAAGACFLVFLLIPYLHKMISGT